MLESDKRILSDIHYIEHEIVLMKDLSDNHKFNFITPIILAQKKTPRNN